MYYVLLKRLENGLYMQEGKPTTSKNKANSAIYGISNKTVSWPSRYMEENQLMPYGASINVETGLLDYILVQIPSLSKDKPTYFVLKNDYLWTDADTYENVVTSSKATTKYDRVTQDLVDCWYKDLESPIFHNIHNVKEQGYDLWEKTCNPEGLVRPSIVQIVQVTK